MAHEHDDLRSIREEFPRTEQELESIAMASFLDYLLVEVDLERLEEVLEVWANDARSSMAEGAMDRALWLMEVADVAARASQPGDTQRRRLFEEKKKRVLDKSVLGDLMQTGGDHASADPVLAMFGGAAAETLLDWLADEDDRTRRVTIINRLAEMTDEHLEVITERLSDPRWFVVRNIVTILHRSKHASSFVPLFERAANHQHPSVVKEAVAALGSVNTAAAASVLADLVYSGSDPETKRRALEELGKNRTPQAIAVLRSMASFRGKPRIRRSLRRQAKKLLRSQAAR